MQMPDTKSSLRIECPTFQKSSVNWRVHQRFESPLKLEQLLILIELFAFKAYDEAQFDKASIDLGPFEQKSWAKK